MFRKYEGRSRAGRSTRRGPAYFAEADPGKTWLFAPAFENDRVSIFKKITLLAFWQQQRLASRLC